MPNMIHCTPPWSAPEQLFPSMHVSAHSSFIAGLWKIFPLIYSYFFELEISVLRLLIYFQMSAQISLPQRLLPDHALKMAPSQFLLSKLLLFFSHWRRKWQPTPVLLPGKSHGWRSLIGYSPWGRKESDTTERLQFYFQ